MPALNQLSAVECGAACLAMVLSHYGRQTSVAECRDKCGLGRDGLTARAIARTAREYGLRVKAYSLEPAALKFLRFPAIVHWEFNHFIVLESWSPKKVAVVDPSVGRRRLTAEEFSDGFTGVVLTLEPGVHFTERRRTGGPSWLKYLKGMFESRGAKATLAQIILTSFMLQLFGLGLPVFTKIFIDHVLPFRITNLVTIIGVGMLILILAQTSMSFLRSMLMIFLRGRLDAHLMLNFFEHLLSLPFSFFQQRTSGDLLMRLGSNSLIREMLTNQTLSVFLDGSFVLIYLFILLVIPPPLGLIVIGIGLLQILVMLATSRRVRELSQRDLVAKADEQSYLVEAMKGIAMLKASGAEDVAFDRWSNLFFTQINVSIQRSYFSAFIETSIGMLRNLSPLLLLWVGAIQVLNGTMSLGSMLAVNVLANAFLGPLTTLVMSAQQLQIVGANLDRIADVLETEPEQPFDTDQKSPQITGRIEVQNLHFQYDPNAPMVLRDISLVVEPGQKLALVGPTGSGKSTLAMLLLGLYSPTQGEILYGGVPLKKFNYRSLRSKFGVVLQDSFLFSGSIRQNITLSNPDMPMEEIIKVAELAGIHEEINRMPMAYETIVSEGGTTLSGGQRQRLALARALAHKPSILVLDEATSHLDVITESEVDEHLTGLSCTRIVIAHRLSTIRNADKIVVLDNGFIVEQGSHDQLMAKEGHYAALVRNQIEKSLVSMESAEIGSLKLGEDHAPIDSIGSPVDLRIWTGDCSLPSSSNVSIPKT